MGYIVVGKGKAETWSNDASNLEPQDKDLWERARECNLLSKGHEGGAFDIHGNPMDDGWICVVSGDIDESDLDYDDAVIAYCSTGEDDKTTDTSAAVNEVAAQCAQTLIEQGWDGEPESYDLGNFLGDIEALQTKLGKTPSRGQRLALEAAIREGLQAAKVGAESGEEEVDTVLQEQGASAVIATLAPGHLGWDEGAINAHAHKADHVDDAFSDLYYKAYAKAARKRAEEIRAEKEAA